MACPVRSAAERAKQLISQGFGVKVIDAIGSPGLTEEEEDKLNAEIAGVLSDEYIYLNEVDGKGCCLPDDATAEDVRFSSYEDDDVQPPGIDFRPSRQPGLHLAETITRGKKREFCRAIDFFQLFMPDSFLEEIVENTNFYALINIHDKPTYAIPNDGSWEDVSLQELKQYIAYVIFNGFAGRKSIERNWCQETLYSGGWARRFLSKNRFKAVSAMIHVSKPGEEDMQDKLCKIRPMLQHMKNVCQKYFQPSRAVSIDERMVASKGRSPIQQYMPSKPTRFGYKLWCLCDPATGYTYDFSVYTGKSAKRSQNGLGFDVVASLVTPYIGQGYIVYCDSFFTSVPLAKYLLQCGTYLCGTLQPWRRGFPTILKEKSWIKKATQGDMRYTQQEGMLVMQWYDKQIVNLMSSFHQGHKHIFLIRRGKEKDGKYKRSLVRMPVCVRSYNKCMGGVDLADQMLETYNCLTKTRRWWKTLFFHMVDLAVLNSYILFKLWRKEHPEVLELSRCAAYSHLHFREELVRQLARIRYDEETPIYYPAFKRKKSLNCTGPHEPEYTTIRRNCRVCYVLHGKQKKSYARCSDRQCQVHLCFNKKRNCFPIWHSSSFDKYRYKAAVED